MDTGLLNGLPPNLTQEEVKREFPCFTGETEEGLLYNYGGGVFFINHDMYFYTFARFLEIRKGFKVRTSIPVFGRTRAELVKVFMKFNKPYWAKKYSSLEFVDRSWGCLILDFTSGRLESIRAFKMPCESMRDFN